MPGLKRKYTPAPSGSYGIAKKRTLQRAAVRGSVAIVNSRRAAPLATRGFFGARAGCTNGIERKVVDTAEAGYGCNTTGSVTLINGAAQGSDYTQRIGRKTCNVAVQLEGSVQPEDNTTVATKARVMLVYDSQPNGAALPAITDILTASTSNAFMNLANRDRFKILAEWNDSIGGTSNTATQAYAQGPSILNVSIYKRINLPTIWNGTAATIGTISSGSILLVTVGDRASGSAATFLGAARVRFTDN